MRHSEIYKDGTSVPDDFDTLPYRDQLGLLDPKRDSARILHLAHGQSKYDLAISSGMQLFSHIAVPAISEKLVAAGGLIHRTKERLHDTGVLAKTINQFGPRSKAGQKSALQIKRTHEEYGITLDTHHDELWYVLSTFIYGPRNHMQKFGWREQGPKEQEAFFHFWREIGELMGIDDLPTDDATFADFHRQFEVKNIRYAPSNEAVAQSVLDHIDRKTPRPLRGIVRAAIYTLIGKSVADAINLEAASPRLSGIVLALASRRNSLKKLLATNESYEDTLI